MALVAALGSSEISSVIAAPGAPQQPADAPPTAEQSAFFTQNIKPILVNRCYDCHSAQTRASGGLRLDDRDAFLKGGKDGSVIVPGDPDRSLLIERVTSPDPQQRMPKDDDPLSPKEIDDLKTWISQGALWPNPTPTAPAPTSAPPQPPVAVVAYPRPASAQQLQYFEKNVRPILVNRCYNCHSNAFKEAGGLRVDVGIAIFAGGKDGPVIVPGHPEKSLLIEKIKSTDPKKRMPQESKDPLPPEEIAILETWIADGAAWPDETEKLPPTPARLLALYPKLRSTWWSWQPLANPSVPAVANTSWPCGNIDRFILANLEQKKLAPVSDAPPVTLLRRLHYDLTGLPPSPQEIESFSKHHSQRAYQAIADRLLASPQFGERFGRHWLDVARYAESSGPSRNMPYPNAWRYRDYVIDAFNHDEPINRFFQEQIAGDLLPASTPAERDRLLIATGYLALGPKDVNQRFQARFRMDIVDDQIDTVMRSTMALTVSCARCHDHKFDPIPTTDYYALAGIFASTEDDSGLRSGMGGASLDYYDPKHLGYLSTAAHAPTAPGPAAAQLRAQVDAAKKQVDALADEDAAALKANPTRPPLPPAEVQRRAEIQRHYIELKENLALLGDAGEEGYAIHSVRDAAANDTTVRIRGVEERHGPAVPRGFLTLVRLSNPAQIPQSHSGRLELAQWITRPDNPLTPRVYANRVWEYLFGTGLVGTVDNFGSMGDKPSNPALLDYLAQDFIRNGWSTKKLVREIVLSHAYRLGSSVPPGYEDVDPANRFLWRHSPRRLETEEVRDSILASSGDLDLARPPGSPSMALRMIEIRDDGPVVASILAAADKSTYRSIYLPLLRDETPSALAAFDPVSQTLVSGNREVTTVPSQALFMLNSPFVRGQALILADRLLAEHGSDSKRIRHAYERIAGYDPSSAGAEKIKVFLAQYAAAWTQSHGSAPGRPRPPQPIAGNPGSITAGIVREDGLTQDDTVDIDRHGDPASAGPQPQSASQAAWAAFIQALFGSAAFQFVR